MPTFDSAFQPMLPTDRTPRQGQSASGPTAASQSAPSAVPPTPKADDIDLRELEKILGTWGSVERTLRQQERPQALQSRAISVSLSPGAQSPEVAVPHNYVVTLEFLDNAGAPWPIRKVLVGSADAFVVEQGVSSEGTAPPQPAVASTASAPAPIPRSEMQTFPASGDRTAEPVAPAQLITPPPDGSNILLVSAKAPYAASNVAVLLQGTSTPISIALAAVEPSAKQAYTDRYTMLLDGFGPYAPPIRDYSGPADTLGDVVAVLANQAPEEGATIAIADGLGSGTAITGAPRIWRKGNTLWLRTQDTLLSPAPTAKVSRGDWTAYRLPYLPVILLSREGNTYQVRVR
jgi:hypothetical protein